MTSPIKPGRPPTRGTQAAQRQLKQNNAVSDVSPEAFLEHYLPAASQQPPAEQWTEEQQTSVNTIRDVIGDEATIYQPLIELCNSVSRSVSQSLGVDDTFVRFHSHDNKTLHHPLEPSLKPDIVVCREEVLEPEDSLRKCERAHVGMADPIPSKASSPHDSSPVKAFTWFNIAAVGEVKKRDPEDERYQTANYLHKYLQLRPELHSVLGFSADTKGYSLYYHDASVIHQCSVEWDDPLMLYAFVRQLYAGTPSDPSIVNLCPNDPDPSWLMNINGVLLLITCATPDAGLGQRRLVARATNVEKHETWFIKDFYPDMLRRFNEGRLYDKAHKGQMLPGMMRAKWHGHPLDISGSKLTTTNFGKGPGPGGKRVDRCRMRIATKDVGEPLEKVSSLLEFLKIMYDACVVQRNLHRKHVLHRDISENNIMMAPKDEGCYYEACKVGFNEVKYLNQVINPEETPKPACLVIDLGHGADLEYLRSLPDSDKESEELAGITGTPKFISRSISIGKLLPHNRYKPDGIQIPKLDEQAHTRYTSCFAEYDAYSKAVDEGGQPSRKSSAPDKDNQLSVHDHERPPRPAATKFRHQLFHDAESTFWVIAWFLARSVPKNYQREDLESKDELTGFVEAMEYHTPGNKRLDTRAVVSTDLETWRQILHPELAHVAPMLSDMHEYISPEWGYRPDLTENFPEHAHEALMRLLLRSIIPIVDGDIKDVEFAPAGTRPLPMSDLPTKSKSNTISSRLVAPSTSAPNTKKRSRGPEDDGAELPKPRRSKRLELKPKPSEDQSIPDKARAYQWPEAVKSYKLDVGNHLFSLPTTAPVVESVVPV